ncbi:hypothetical protein BHM03_00002715 [Ensete ventricosum]|nr:hypothetical protein BHM03_00002715 [Ensete ventricosum]
MVGAHARVGWGGGGKPEKHPKSHGFAWPRESCNTRLNYYFLPSFPSRSTSFGLHITPPPSSRTILPSPTDAVSHLSRVHSPRSLPLVGRIPSPGVSPLASLPRFHVGLVVSAVDGCTLRFTLDLMSQEVKMFFGWGKETKKDGAVVESTPAHTNGSLANGGKADLAVYEQFEQQVGFLVSQSSAC